MEIQSENVSAAFIPAGESDAHTMGILRQQAWSDTYRGIYPDEMIDNFDYAWHAERDLRRIQSPQYQNYLIQVAHRNVGYLIVRKGNPLLLQSLYLLPEAQRKGIGRQVFSMLRSQCAEQNIDSFICHCQPDNRRAIGFYEKMCGVVIDRDEGNEERWQDSIVFEFRIAV